MPKLEPKQIQKELDQGEVWPFYWLYGAEAMKSRELVKRIKKAAWGTPAAETESSAGGLFAASFNEVVLTGNEVTGPEVLDQAHSLSLGGGLRVIVVKDAHLLKQPEGLAELFGPKQKRENFSAIVICVSKDLDQRKKFSKALIESAACVPCEEIGEGDREAWVGYLAKRKSIELTPEMIMILRAMDPWSLDLIERELEKLEIAGRDPEVLIAGAGTLGAEERFIARFFERDRTALAELASFADLPDKSLPLLGLMAWNTRMLSQILKDREARTREVKLGPFLMERFQRYQHRWSLAEVSDLQHRLTQIDFSMKQTPRVAIGIWTELVLHFSARENSTVE